MSEEKQFEPSQKKLDKAKREGKLAKSREISIFLQLTTCYYLLFLLDNYSNKFVEIYHKVMRGKEWDHIEFILGISIDWFSCISIQMLLWVAPLWVITFFSELFQVGVSFSMKRVEIKFSNINPLNGIKKIFGEREGMKAPWGLLIFSLELLSICVMVMSITLYSSVRNVMKLLHVNPEIGFSSAMISSVNDLLGYVILLVGVYAIYKYQSSRVRLKRDLMMSMEEMKREHKEDEGDPHLKNQRKSLHQEAVLHGNIENVRKAKVLVVSN